MKIRITDLLDQYHDESVMLTPPASQSKEDVVKMNEPVNEIKQSKHRFGWKEGLAVAAAAAVLVLGGFGVSRLIRKGRTVDAPVIYETGDTTTNTELVLTTDTSEDHEVEPVSKTEVELAPELQKQANRFLTRFAEQWITALTPEDADPYTLVSFAHLYYKINDRDAIGYQSLDDESYETLTEAQVNEVLLRYMNRTVTVADGTDFTEQRGDNYAVHEMFRDGFYWFPAADGDMHAQIAVCERVEDNQDGTWTLHYRVYDFMGPVYLSPEEKEALTSLTVKQAEQDDQYILVMCGAAVVQRDDSFDAGWYLRSLHASNVGETDPGESQDPTDPVGTEDLLADPELRASINSLLSRLAEQDVSSLSEMKEDDAALMTFAHHLAKLHPDANYPIQQQSRNGADYDTMKLSDINGILGQIFGVEVDPEEGKEYISPLRGNNVAAAFVDNGVVWFPAGEGYTYPCFVVCTEAKMTEYGYEDGDVSVDLGCIAVEFNVYETMLEDYESGKVDDYCRLTAQEAEALAAQKVFYLTEKGTAIIQPVGGGSVLNYERSWVEPEGWEEEFPQEYPVTEYRIEGEGFRQSGEVNLYRYEQLPAAEHYVDILAEIARKALGDDALIYEEDSPHDGYANWFADVEVGSSSISGSSITGRFTYSLYPGFDRVLEQSQRTVEDRDAMEQAAKAFVDHFTGITGELVLVGSKDEEDHYHDERFTGLRDVIVPSVIFYFRSEENSKITLRAQDGLEVPVTCGDSSLDDLTDHVFAVRVWPDGTVVRADNYISRAEIVSDGAMEIPGEPSMDYLLTFMTSYKENDTFVLESAGVDSYGVYFGSAEIAPILTVKYHFASDPDDHRSTDFYMPGLFD